jgi:hypothetical protein
LPGGRYALAALDAFSIIALNSAPVHALPVLTLEMVPDAEAAINAAIMDSPSLASEISRKSFAGRDIKADYFTSRCLDDFPDSGLSVLWRSQQTLEVIMCETPTRN